MSEKMGRRPPEGSFQPPFFTGRWILLLALAVGLAAVALGNWPGFSSKPAGTLSPASNGFVTGPPEGSSPTSGSGAGTVRQIASTLGDTLAGYDYLVTVDDRDHSDIFNDQLSASQDHTFVAFYVTVESQSDTGLEVNPRYWRLFDDQTPAYPEVYAGKDPALVINKTLLKGQILQGWVTFEIPKGASRFKLAYDIPNIPEKVSFVFDVG